MSFFYRLFQDQFELKFITMSLLYIGEQITIYGGLVTFDSWCDR